MRRTVSRENISTISALLCDLHCLKQVKDGYKELQELGLISLSCFSNTVDSVSCNKVLCTWQVINTFCAQSKLFCFRITPILNYHKEKYSVKEILNSKSPNSFNLSDLRFLFMSSGGSHVLLQFRLH